MSDQRSIDSKKYAGSPYRKTSYFEDMAIKAFETPFRKKCLIAGVIFGVAFPFISPPFILHVINLIAIASIGALALNLLIGNAGLLSLGHAGFMAAGAFTTAIMTVNFGMPIWIVLPAAILIGGLFGFVAGLPSYKLKGIYLGLSTLAVHHIIQYGCSEYQYYGGFGYGIVIKAPSIGHVVLTNKIEWYFFLWIIAALVALFITNLLRSKPGRAWVAIRDRDIAAEVIGINIGDYKIMAFILSSGLTSLAGSLYAYYTAVASADQYSFSLTISYFAMVIVGGVGSVLGSFLGAFLITVLPYGLMYLTGLFEVSFSVKEYFSIIESAIFGIVIVLFLLAEPMGLAEIWRRTRIYFELWPFRYKPLTITKR